jgi:hypothetical protein
MPSTLSASVFHPGILAQSACCGWKDAAQFDKVIVPCGVDYIPPPLLSQRRPNGILVIPIGRRVSTSSECGQGAGIIGVARSPSPSSTARHQGSDGTGRSSGADGRPTICSARPTLQAVTAGPLRLFCNTAAQFARLSA